MKVKLGRQVEFDHVTYAKGEHDNFPDALLKHWYFQALMKDGDAILLDGVPVEAAVTLTLNEDEIAVVADEHGVQAPSEATEEKPRKKGKGK